MLYSFAHGMRDEMSKYRLITALSSGTQSIVSTLNVVDDRQLDENFTDYERQLWRALINFETVTTTQMQSAL